MAHRSSGEATNRRWTKGQGLWERKQHTCCSQSRHHALARRGNSAAYWRRLASRFTAVIFAAHVAAPIAHFISLKVSGGHGLPCGPLAIVRETAIVAVLTIVPVGHMAIKIIRAIKPRDSADEDAPTEPFRAVVAVWGASIRTVVIVAVRTFRSDSDANIETDLSRCLGGSWRYGRTPQWRPTRVT